jgi:hypothetical protein
MTDIRLGKEPRMTARFKIVAWAVTTLLTLATVLASASAALAAVHGPYVGGG